MNVNKRDVVMGILIMLIGGYFMITFGSTGGEWVDYPGGVHVYERNEPSMLFYVGIVITLIGGACIKDAVQKEEGETQTPIPEPSTRPPEQTESV